MLFPMQFNSPWAAKFRHEVICDEHAYDQVEDVVSHAAQQPRGCEVPP